MMKFFPARVLLFLIVMVVPGASQLRADLIPPGNKGVSHKLVFVDSPLLESHRLIATPTRGFGGHEEVRANRPFSFSSKYGTRLYVVPKDFEPPSKVMFNDPLPFPFCEVPVSCTTYVPVLSPVASLRSTCKLVAVGEDSIQVELVDHVELDSNGQPVTMSSIVVPLVAISATGLIGCCLVWRRTRFPKQPIAA